MLYARRGRQDGVREVMNPRRGGAKQDDRRHAEPDTTTGKCTDEGRGPLMMRRAARACWTNCLRIDADAQAAFAGPERGESGYEPRVQSSCAAVPPAARLSQDGDEDTNIGR